MKKQEIKDILPKVILLLSDEKNWTKGCFARDASGLSTPAQSSGAVSFCVMGAFVACGASFADMPDIKKLLRKSLKESPIGWDHGYAISMFNDDPKTTHADMLKVLETASRILNEELNG